MLLVIKGSFSYRQLYSVSANFFADHNCPVLIPANCSDCIILNSSSINKNNDDDNKVLYRQNELIKMNIQEIKTTIKNNKNKKQTDKSSLKTRFKGGH